MTDKAWKRIERQIAERLNGSRIPITGRQRGSAPDVEHPTWAIECKHRDGFPPAWILDSLDQAKACSEGGKKLPIAIWHGKGKKIDDSVVMIPLKDFQEWFGE